jgi:putative ATPase
MAVMIENNQDEVLTYSPGDKTRDKWVNRVTSGQGQLLQEIRDRIFEKLKIQRHEKVMIGEEKSGLFLWEAFRKAPEGLVCGLIPDQREFALTEHYSQTLPENERPFIYNRDILTFNMNLQEETEGILFDSLAARDIIRSDRDCKTILDAVIQKLDNNGKFAIAEVNPSGGTKLSSFLKVNLDDIVFSNLQDIEEKLYCSRGYNRKTEIFEVLNDLPLIKSEIEEVLISEQRTILPEQLDRWFNLESEKSYGYSIKKELGEKSYKEIKEILTSSLSGKTVYWEKSYLFLYGEKE